MKERKELRDTIINSLQYYWLYEYGETNVEVDEESVDEFVAYLMEEEVEEDE